jgi:hypothetical protein
VYRAEIGAVAVGVLLFVLTTLRLASYGRAFTSFGAGPVKTEADDPMQAIDAAGIDVEELGAEVPGSPEGAMEPKDRQPSTQELAARVRAAGRRADLHAKSAAHNPRRAAAAMRANGYGSSHRHSA